MIFFDIDGTLLDHLRAERAGALAFRETYADAFPEVGDAFVSLWHDTAEYHMDRYIAGETTYIGQRHARMRELFARSARELSDDEANAAFECYLENYRANWYLFDDVLPCLDALSARRLGIISNAGYDQQILKLERTGIRGRFETVAISGEVGISKPDERIFHVACERGGVAPSDCVYIGDRLTTDAVAARDAGLRGVWLDRWGGARGDEDVEVITSLRELLDIVPLDQA